MEKRISLIFAIMVGLGVGLTYAQTNNSKSNPKIAIHKWKTITIGGVSKDTLIKNLKRDGYTGYNGIGGADEKLIMSPAFPILPTPRQVTLVLVTMKEIGYNDSVFSLNAFYKQAQKIGLKLCPPEVALYAVRKISNFDFGEVSIFIGAERIDDGSNVNDNIFMLERRPAKEQGETYPDANGHLITEFRQKKPRQIVNAIFLYRDVGEYVDERKKHHKISWVFIDETHFK